MFENGFPTTADPVIHPWSSYFLHFLSISQVCVLFIFESKSQRSKSLGTGFRTVNDSVIHLWSWNFIHLLPISKGRQVKSEDRVSSLMFVSVLKRYSWTPPNMTISSICVSRVTNNVLFWINYYVKQSEKKPLFW